MAYFAGVVRGAPVELPVEDQPRSKAGSEGEEEQVPGGLVFPRAEVILGQGACIGIIFEVNGRPGKGRAEEVHDGDVAPAREVGRLLDQAGFPVHRRTAGDADSLWTRAASRRGLPAGLLQQQVNGFFPAE